MAVPKKASRKQYAKGESLPKKLAQKIEQVFFDNDKLEYRTKNNFLQCIAIIFYYQVTQGNGLTVYVPLGRNYWKKIYGGNYRKSVISPLIQNGIIESLDFGFRTIPDGTVQTTKGKQDGYVGVRYRINPELLEEQFIFLPYVDKGKVLTALERILFDTQEFKLPELPDLNFRVNININKANSWVEDNAERICNEMLKRDTVNSLPDGLQIECREYLDNGSFNVRYQSVKWSRIIAEAHNKEFFYFNNSYYIAKVDEFLQQRIPALIYHYKHEISKIGTSPVEEKRSPVTLRVYSHLTNFPSRILQFININNKAVVQLDLRTSQFLIFANLLNAYIKAGEQHLLSLFKQSSNKTYLKRLISVLKQHQAQLPQVAVDISNRYSGNTSSCDVTNFINDVFFKDFYTVVQQELGLDDRLIAKHALFKLLFKKTNRPDELLNKLAQLYPIVINIIAEFKKPDKKKAVEAGDDTRESNFSVFLQCIEAEIFVDNILKRLRDEGIPCFSRHDSIVVVEGFEKDAERIAKTVFADFGFKYNHKVEEKFWEAVDFEELDDDPYMQWLTDEDILTTNYDTIDGFAEPIKDDYMDEDEIQTCHRVLKIGLQDDYYEHVDADFLEDISNLSWLNQSERNILFDDIINLRSGFSFVQGNTNQLLRNLVERIMEMDLQDEW